jgi:hypothetical protein
MQNNFQIQQQKNNKARFEAKAGPGKKSLLILFIFEVINALLRQLQLKPDKTASSKKGTRKAEFILSTEINLTTSSDEGEKQDYLLSYFF